MTDRISAFIVILEKDIREDDAQSTIDAIKHIKGVLSVEPVAADGIAVSIAEMRVCTRLWDKIAAIFTEEFKR